MVEFVIPLLNLLQEGGQPPGGGESAPTAAPPGGDIWTMLIPMILIFVVFYFLLIRPQQRQAREREQMIGNLRRRDVVVTSGGIKGRIEKIRDNEMTLVIDEKKDVRIRILKSAVVALDQKGDGDAEEDDEPSSSKDGESDTGGKEKASGEKP